MARYVVVIDDPINGPYFLPPPDSCLPEIFKTWEAAWDSIAAHDLTDTAQVLRLRSG